MNPPSKERAGDRAGPDDPAKRAGPPRLADLPARPDDRLLVEQARRGNTRAFRTLVETYQRKVYAVALGMLRDPDAAHDIAQDAFLKAHQHLDSFQGSASFYTWIYRITVNLCIDQLRKAGRGSQVEFDETINTEAAGSPADELSPRRLGFDPDRALKDKELRQRLQQALGELSEQHRSVLVLREVDGLSYKEMADVLECAEGTIMSRLFHARKRMQELLRGYVDVAEEAATEAR